MIYATFDRARDAGGGEGPPVGLGGVCVCVCVIGKTKAAKIVQCNGGRPTLASVLDNGKVEALFPLKKKGNNSSAPLKHLLGPLLAPPPKQQSATDACPLLPLMVSALEA